MYTSVLFPSECTSGQEITVKEADFDVKDNDANTPDDPSSVFSPGEKQPNHKITIKSKDSPGSDSLIPMSVTPATGSNIKEIEMKIYPIDPSGPTTIMV